MEIFPQTDLIRRAVGPFAWEFRRGREVLSVPTHGRRTLTHAQAMVAGAGVAQVLALGVGGVVPRLAGRDVPALPGAALAADGPGPGEGVRGVLRRDQSAEDNVLNLAFAGVALAFSGRAFYGGRHVRSALHQGPADHVPFAVQER